MGALAEPRAARGGPALAQVAARRSGRVGVRRPRARRRGRRRRRARRVPLAGADPGRRTRAAPRSTGRGVRPGQHADRLPGHRRTPSSSPPAGRAAWSVRVVTADADVRPRRRARHRARGTAGCSCSTATTPPSRPATARRCRRWCTAGPAGPAAARSWAACAASPTTCSAPRCRPAPRCCSARSPAAGCAGAARHGRRRPPVPQVAGRAADRRHRRRRAARWSPARTSRTSPSSPATPSTPTPTTTAAAANPFFDGIGWRTATWSSRSRPGCSSTPSPGPVLANYGIDNLRFLTPVYPGDELTVTLTCKADHPARTASTARSGGTPRSPSRTASVAAQYDVLTMVAKEWQPMTDDRSNRRGPRARTSTRRSRTTGASSRATGCPTPTARR